MLFRKSEQNVHYCGGLYSQASSALISDILRVNIYEVLHKPLIIRLLTQWSVEIQT